ncbi:DUF6221 family protein [Streptomyces tremellae]|uniref:Uncharacterized protein n=1 Tax=Streptomyces tremellae TaxID=1124239 RepID=A0ABP7EKB9_9ACTN
MNDFRDLIAFVQARLDEDEAVANAPADAAWATTAWTFHSGDNPYVDLGTQHLDNVSALNAAEMEHIARHDPARVLRRTAAARELLSRYEAMEADVPVVTGVEAILSEYRRAILPQLAAEWADHPDYQETWRA